MKLERTLFQRTALLAGHEGMERIAGTRVIIFGLGGVGSWCAESLIRSGIRTLTLVDSDRVCITNINRQLMATTHTIGTVKVEALKQRLLEINPSAEITALQTIYDRSTSDAFHLESYHYIIDAIDSLTHKAHLIQAATNTSAVFFSSMGAALKMDPTAIRVTEFWKVKGCPLSAALRRKLRKEGMLPGKKFLCVYSEELLDNAPQASTTTTCGTPSCLCPHLPPHPDDPHPSHHEWCSQKAQINGSMAHITAIFGFTLAGLVMRDVLKPEQPGI
ncbi:MAG: tRNA threonylcarbamoyladenosine dehydratase [Dysgonamonadaceae bacterium]|jgi:tRNA A37 threonylcarbamoyladenosine dehydratase|nr:tRNA threonylcarbamoyladenosine dehydratase [Dysgonamonadaceae bacterium]